MQVRLSAFRTDGTMRYDFGPWWLWIGFGNRAETAFFVPNQDLGGPLVGVRQGTLLRYLEAPSGKSGPGALSPNPVGDYQYYSWKKNITGQAQVDLPRATSFDGIEIKRVCKAEAKYRTVHLYDDSPVKVCPGFNCYTTREPREAWIDEARIDATCQDGKKVYFQYGPTGSRNGREGRSPVQGYFDQWFQDAWKKVPRGVQFVGNRPPTVVDYDIRVELGKSTEFNLVASVRDPDGDPLSIVGLSQSSYGALEQLPNGRYRYTTHIDCKWIERLHFRASDGMAESDQEAKLTIRINPESMRCKDESDARGRAKRALVKD